MRHDLKQISTFCLTIAVIMMFILIEPVNSSLNCLLIMDACKLLHCGAALSKEFLQ